MSFQFVFLASMAMLAAAAAASEPQAVLSVGDVIAQHEALDGKLVHVRGWLYAPCYPLACTIRARNERLAPQLSIGGSPAFDRDVTAMTKAGSEIVIEGRVNRRCFDHGRDADAPRYPAPPCTDRADQLAEPRLVEVISPPSQEL